MTRVAIIGGTGLNSIEGIEPHDAASLSASLAASLAARLIPRRLQ